MSEELISKIKKTFDKSIFTKQAVLDQDLYEVSIFTKHAILKYAKDKLTKTTIKKLKAVS